MKKKVGGKNKVRKGERWPVPQGERKGKYWEALNLVEDPEMMVGIVDLGLVYDVEVREGIAYVTMTLTSLGCPLGPQIMGDVQKELMNFKEIKDVDVNLVWDPAWRSEMMSEDVRYLLWGV